jgi:hypothetical protein
MFISHYTSFKWLCAAITSCSKVVVMTISTENLVILWSKWLINQCLLALNTFEAELVPMVILV